MTMTDGKKLNVRGVLFDWDGTLVDSYAADSSAYLAMFREMGITWGLEELAQHYSPNWYDVYRAADLPKKNGMMPTALGGRIMPSIRRG